ncbi:MAG TPA: FecR domain-containing protein, partial [Polyangiaceae bacterium]|nr:FecR domain-containing protein [Polyangiaceae bacterium]
AVERRLRAGAARAQGRARLLWIPALAVAAGTVGFFWVKPPPLEYEVRGARADGPYVSAPADESVTVAFSDGSSLAADPGSRLRVDEARVAGARVLVERGRATVHVEHHATSAWDFVAGPFDVRVTGTRFELAWDPTGEAVDLKLEEGSVEVRGPFAEAPIAVRAGQRFRADLASRSMTVIDRESASASAAPNSAAPAPSDATPAPVATATTATPSPAVTNDATPSERPEPSSTRAAPSAPVSESWATLVARGQFETVVAKAGDRGASECDKSCSAADLKALADAARYTGRSSLAEDALLSLRRRFGGTREGRSASFMLGRLNEARGAESAAERWYDTYLSELPAGELAAEALAGKMRAVLATAGRAQAEPIAAEYLARYPNGVHAKTARDILAPPARP